MKSILRPIFKCCIALLFLLGVGVVGGTLYLKEKPLPIDFLITRIAASIHQSHPGMVLEVGQAHLVWDGLRPTVKVSDIRLSQDGALILSALHADISLSLKSFWAQRAIPTEITIQDPLIVIPPLTTDSSVEGTNWPNSLSDQPDLEELDEIYLENGRLAFQDNRLAYTFPHIAITFDTKTTSLHTEGTCLSDDSSAPIGLDLTLDETSETPYLSFKVEGKSISEAFVRDIIEIIGITAPEDTHYQGLMTLKAEGMWPLHKGKKQGAQVSLSLRNQEAGHLQSPMLEGKWDIQSFEIEAALEGAATTEPELWKGSLILKDLTLAQGARLEGTVHATLALDELMLKLHLEGLDIPTQFLHIWWPKGLGDDARTWVIENIPAAFVPNSVLDTTLKGTLKEDQYDWALESLGGTIDIEEASVRYLDGQPLVEHVFGKATFSPKAFDIDVSKGQLGEAHLSKGKVWLRGLDQTESTAEIEATLEGSASSILHTLSLPPFDYAAAEGLQSKSIKGDVTGKINVRFPLHNDVQLKDVRLEAVSHFKNIAAAWQLDDINLSLREGDFKVDVTHKGFKGSGSVIVQDAPLTLTFDTLFSKTAPYRTRYQVRGRVTAAHAKHLGWSLAPYVSGPIDLHISSEEKQNRDLVTDLQLGLEAAGLQAPQIHWMKKSGVPCRCFISLIKTPKSWSMPAFSLQTPDALVHGRLFPEKPGVRLEVDQFILGGHDVRGTAIIQKDPISAEWGAKTISLRGKYLNAVPFLEATDEKDTPWDGIIELNVASTQLLKGETVHNLNGRWKHEKNETTYLNMTFDWAPKPLGDKSNTFIIQSVGNKSVLKGSIHDVGRLLKGLGWFDTLQGGDATIQAITPHTSEALKNKTPMTGHIKITNFRLVGTPILTRLLSALSIEGLVSLLRGEGIGFEEANLTFEKYRDRTVLKKGRMVSTALGISAHGTLFKTPSTVAFKGRIVPAYAINATIGNLPLIGTFLSGGQGNEGVFAATFEVKGPTHDPVVTVNPLSLLTPGIIRKIFEGEESDDFQT